MEQFAIDAWIDNPSPRIKLTNKHTGALVAEWAGERAKALFEEGIVTLAELSSLDRAVQMQVAKDLVLVACTDSLKSQVQPENFKCSTKPMLLHFKALNDDSGRLKVA